MTSGGAAAAAAVPAAGGSDAAATAAGGGGLSRGGAPMAVVCALPTPCIRPAAASAAQSAAGEVTASFLFATDLSCPALTFY